MQDRQQRSEGKKSCIVILHYKYAIHAGNIHSYSPLPAMQARHARRVYKITIKENIRLLLAALLINYRPEIFFCCYLQDCGQQQQQKNRLTHSRSIFLWPYYNSGLARGFEYTVSGAILIQVYGISWSKFGYKVFNFS